MILLFLQEELEGVIIGAVSIAIFSFCLGLWYLTYVAYCQRCCRQPSSGNRFERTQARISVREAAPEMPKCDQEDESSSIVFSV